MIWILKGVLLCDTPFLRHPMGKWQRCPGAMVGACVKSLFVAVISPRNREMPKYSDSPRPTALRLRGTPLINEGGKVCGASAR